MSICSVRGQHCLSRVKSLQMGEKEGQSLNSLLPHCLWLEVYMSLLINNDPSFISEIKRKQINSIKNSILGRGLCFRCFVGYE